MATMRNASSSSPDDTFFNDLSQPAPTPPSQTHQNSSSGNRLADGASVDNGAQPRAKRIACVLCRKRKLRCDGARPKCGTCSRLSHDCGYDEVRKKSGPKRGYVKLLEARLQQVETMLQREDRPDQNKSVEQVNLNSSLSLDTSDAFSATSMASTTATSNRFTISNSALLNASDATPPPRTEMIGLGLEEPLPPQEVIDDLHEIYFRQVHPTVPMIHRPRYLAAMNLIPSMRPPVCLRYIIWTLAASTSDKYFALADTFYRRARRYAEMDEMKGHGEAIITIGHCQTWILISWYEFKNMYFPRAWIDTGRASSLALMMGLNRIDGAGLDVKQCLPPPKDWTEREERRRTFWMTFCADRYASIGTGWALRLDEQDIMTLLPASDEAYDKSRPEPTPSLEQAFSLSGSTSVSSIASVILIACLLGRNLTHLHRPTPHDNEEDLNGEFWQRHRRLETLLASICLALPDRLRIPTGLPDPNVIFMNMLLHTSVICLHQAAIFKADRNRLPVNIISESRARCVTGALEIARIMKTISHIDLSTLNPFMAFCLYVAARVFVQYLKWRPTDQNMVSSLQFLGSAMHILKRKNPLTESFIAQLEVDLEGTGIILGPKVQNVWKGPNGICPPESSTTSTKRVLIPSEVPVNTDAVKCSPLFEIRNSQSASTDNSVFHPKDFLDTSSNTYPSVQSQINIDVDGTFGNRLSPHEGMQFQLPSRSRDSPFGATSVMIDQVTTPGSSDMDFSTGSGSSNNEKSQSNSYKDNTSHSSFTSPSVQLDQQQGPSYHNSTSRASPQTIESTSALPTPPNAGTSAADVMFLGVPDNIFGNFQGGQVFNAAFPGSDGHMPAGWDFAGVDLGNTTGLTPMADSSWPEVLPGQQSTWNDMQQS